MDMMSDDTASRWDHKKRGKQHESILWFRRMTLVLHDSLDMEPNVTEILEKMYHPLGL